MKSAFRITFVITLLAVCLTFLGILPGTAWNIGDQDFTNIASVILQVQATMFAIIFGFSILSIERASEFHSLEVIHVIIKNSGLPLTIAVYLLSIVISLFSTLWGRWLENAYDIILLVNVLLVLIGAECLVNYLNNVAKGTTTEELLRQLGKSVKVRDIEQLLTQRWGSTPSWISSGFVNYGPLRGIVDIAAEAIGDHNRLLAADALKTMINLAEGADNELRNTVSRNKLARDKLRGYLDRIGARGSPLRKAAWWRLGYEVKPIDIRSYYSTLFFELYKVARDQGEPDVSLLCVRGVRAATGDCVFEMRDWWWTELKTAFLDAVRKGWGLLAKEIAEIINGQFFVNESEITQPLNENLSKAAAFRLHHIEEMIRASIGKTAFREPLMDLLESLLSIANFTVTREETGGTAADALRLLRELLIEIGNSTSQEGDWGYFGDSIIQNCMFKGFRTFEFVSVQPYRLGFAKKDEWWANFPSTYLVDSCMKPLGTFFFSREWGNVVAGLSSVASRVAKNVILVGTAMSKPGYDEYVIESIVGMFKEWFDACPELLDGGIPRNNADLVAKAICRSANHIRQRDERAFTRFINVLKRHFKDTYLWDAYLAGL